MVGIRILGKRMLVKCQCVLDGSRSKVNRGGVCIEG